MFSVNYGFVPATERMTTAPAGQREEVQTNITESETLTVHIVPWLVSVTRLLVSLARFGNILPDKSANAAGLSRVVIRCS